MCSGKELGEYQFPDYSTTGRQEVLTLWLSEIHKNNCPEDDMYNRETELKYDDQSKMYCY